MTQHLPGRSASDVSAPARLTRRRLLAGAGVAALGLARAGRVCSDAPDGPRRLRVLCYNIHHGEGTDGRVDLPRIAAVIRAADPDLVAFQEVDDRTMRTGGVDQTAELARLTGLYGRFGKQIDYEGGGYGQAILSRFPLPELRIHWLPGEPDRERRIAVEAVIDVGGTTVSFASTHLHHQNPSFRTRQAVALNELFANAGRPVVLAGDLNAVPGSEPIAVLEEEWQVVGADSPPTYPAAGPAKRIDHVLVRPGDRFRVLDVAVPEEAAASDHRPVLADLELLSS